MQKTKAALVVVAVVGCFVALLHFLCFATVDIPAHLVKATGTTTSAEKHRGLVLKVFQFKWLKTGDLILVNTLQNDKPVQIIKKLERVDKPVKTKTYGSRNRSSRRVANSLSEMDSPIKYWVVPGDDTNYLASIKRSDIKGMVVWVRK